MPPVIDVPFGVPRVRAFVTLRSGGASQGPYAAADGSGGFNLGLGSGEDPHIVQRNRTALNAVLPSVPAWLKQVHGTRVVDADASAPGASGEADAAISLTPNAVCAVLVADCMPVLIASRDGRAVGAAHAGWRGLAGGVIQNTVRSLRARLGDPHADLVAWLGPAIGPDAFEVGPEVLAAMEASLPNAAQAFTRADPGKYRADLFALGRQALTSMGVDEISGGGLCTFSDAGRFYSFRRDRVTGRHAAFIWIEGEAADRRARV